MYKIEVGVSGDKFNWEQHRAAKTLELDELMDDRRDKELNDFEETED